MKFTRYLLLFHFSRADRAVQIWMHFADNVDESKNCLPTWCMGFWKLERETGGRKQEGGRQGANNTQCLEHGCRESGISGRGWGRVIGRGRKAKIKPSSVVLVGRVWSEVREYIQAVPWVRSPWEWAEISVWRKDSTACSEGVAQWVTGVILVTQTWFQQMGVWEITAWAGAKREILLSLMLHWVLGQDRDLVSHKPHCFTPILLCIFWVWHVCLMVLWKALAVDVLAWVFLAFTL